MRAQESMKKPVPIGIGDVRVSRCGDVFRTILGSCISVCVYDSVARAGGINHFLLPGDDCAHEMSPRYGVEAMEDLLQRCLLGGISPSRMTVKVFGGARVMSDPADGQSVPERNVRFIRHYLSAHGIRPAAEDLGGDCGREVFFFTDSGKVLVRRLGRRTPPE